MGRTIIALVHLGLFAGLVIYGFVLLAGGRINRGLTVLGLMGAYYALVIHKAVLAEIERKRRLRKENKTRSMK